MVDGVRALLSHPPPPHCAGSRENGPNVGQIMSALVPPFLPGNTHAYKQDFSIQFPRFNPSNNRINNQSAKIRPKCAQIQNTASFPLNPKL